MPGTNSVILEDFVYDMFILYVYLNVWNLTAHQIFHAYMWHHCHDCKHIKFNWEMLHAQRSPGCIVLAFVEWSHVHYLLFCLGLVMFIISFCVCLILLSICLFIYPSPSPVLPAEPSPEACLRELEAQLIQLLASEPATKPIALYGKPKVTCCKSDCVDVHIYMYVT